MQASLGISPDGKSWYVVNATPDVAVQLFKWPEFHPKEGVRHTPVKGVLLTDSEFDHTLGLLHLREGTSWSLYATSAALQMLDEGFKVLPALNRYAGIQIEEAPLDSPIVFGESPAQVAVRWVETGRDPPLYTGLDGEVAGAVTALIVEDLNSGRRAVYAPGVSELTDELFDRFSGAEVVLFDGTFWTGDELEHLGGGERTARDMGHVPIDGEEGSAQWLAALPAKLKRYIHINNTNPILDPTSWQRRRLQELGLGVAEDGDEVEL